jgi:hypothetical protein
MPLYHEILPATKSSPHNAIRWSPAEADYSPVCGVLTIQTRRDSGEYLITEFPVAWRGRGFTVARIGAGPESYDVFMSQQGPDADSCDCAGATYAGKCKHMAGLRALLANQWI